MVRSCCVFLIVLFVLLLNACGNGNNDKASLGHPSTNPDLLPSDNNQPSISGIYPSLAFTGQLYDYTPVASDTDNDTLTFSVSNNPNWSSLDSTTGRLSGTPSVADIGQYSNIIITVSDGTASVNLPAFAIDVVSSGTTGWGSQPLTTADRPERAWINNFVGATTIPVTTTFEVAQQQCPVDDYCVLYIDQLSLNNTIELTRSKTKIVGKPGNRVLLEGTGAFFKILSDVEEVIIQGLNIDGQSNVRTPEVFGIVVDGKNTNKLYFYQNTIHDLDGSSDAHGIAVYGRSANDTEAIKNIIIENNTVYDMRTGTSESIVVNGNVSHWEIVDNTVTNINNIAIDAIGGEGTAPTKTVAGRVFPGDFDAARFGFIENNTVSNLSTRTNPAYGSQDSWAAAIYVDGARNILISNNHVDNSAWAYEVGAENCIKSTDITIRNNSARASFYGDILLGGYQVDGYLENTNINCNPNTTSDDKEGHGYTERITVHSNTLSVASTREKKTALQFRVRKSVVIQQGVDAVNENGNVQKDQNSIRTYF